MCQPWSERSFKDDPISIVLRRFIKILNKNVL